MDSSAHGPKSRQLMKWQKTSCYQAQIAALDTLYGSIAWATRPFSSKGDNGEGWPEIYLMSKEGYV
jgi:hypothetical protein